MQRQVIRFSVCCGLIGVMIVVGASMGCKQKKYTAPTLGVSSGDALLGGGGGVAQEIRLWTQIFESQATPGAQATVKIIASVIDSLGQPMPDGTIVIWLASIGTLEEAISTTEQGIAEMTLTFPENFTECSRVTAISGEAQATVKACAAVSTSNIVIRADDTDIERNEHVIVTVQLTTDGKPDVGFQVAFTITQEPSDPPIVAVDNESVVLTDAEGKATIRLDVQNTSGSIVLITVTAKTEDYRSAIIEILVRA